MTEGLDWLCRLLIVMLVTQKHQSWWRHQMKTFSELLTLCAGNAPVIGEFPWQRPVTRIFDALFDLALNERLSKQSRRWWFETPLCPLWCHCNVQKLVLMLVFSWYINNIVLLILGLHLALSIVMGWHELSKCSSSNMYHYEIPRQWP